MENPVNTVETLLNDPAFCDWVAHPTPESNAYWQQFTQQHPDAPVAQARRLLQLLEQRVEADFPTDRQVERMRTGIASRIRTRQTPIRPLWSSTGQWVTAASVVLIMGISGWYYLYRTPAPAIYEQLTAQVDTPLQERSNTGALPILVTLPDGSTASLKPGSRLSYSPATMNRRREVYLTGEAFFNVVKNPERPFFVYANELVTRVLGTSFSVKAIEKEAHVTVSVRTGRVAVFNRTDARADQLRRNPELAGIVLTPNQRLVFDRKGARMQKTLVDKTERVKATNQSPAFVYQDRPISQVFDELEEAFGIEIVYDAGVMENCLLTASLTDEPLQEKLRLICKSIQAQYQVEDERIVITGSGCQ